MNKFNKEFKLIASFASLQESNKTNDRKIVASIIRYTKDINFKNASELINNLSENTSYIKNTKYLVFNVNDYFKMEASLKINLKNFKVVNINPIEIINLILKNKENFSEKAENSVSQFDLNYFFKLICLNLFFKNDSEFKLNLSDYNVIFIFNNITWSNIVFIFKIVQITIYGGSSSRRHLLSTVQSNLVSFLYLINDMYLDTSIIYDSFKQETSSSAKIDKEVVKLVRDKGIEHVNSKNENNSQNLNYILWLNAKYNIYFTIVNKITKYLESYREIEQILKDIASDKIRNTKYSQIGGAWGAKKQQSINKRHVKNAESLKISNLTLENLSLDITTQINSLYNLDRELFDEKGVCKLNHSIIKKDIAQIKNPKVEESKTLNNQCNKLNRVCNSSNLSSNNLQKREYSTRIHKITRRP